MVLHPFRMFYSLYEATLSRPNPLFNGLK